MLRTRYNYHPLMSGLANSVVGDWDGTHLYCEGVEMTKICRKDQMAPYSNACHINSQEKELVRLLQSKKREIIIIITPILTSSNATSYKEAPPNNFANPSIEDFKELVWGCSAVDAVAH